MPVYYGVSGKARLVTRGYYGVNGLSELIIDKSLVPSNDYLAFNYIYNNNSASGLSFNITVNQFTEFLCTFAISSNGSKTTETIFTSGSDYRADIQWSSNTPQIWVCKGSSSKSMNLTTNKEYTLIMGKNTNGDCYLDNTKLFSDITTISRDSVYLLIGNSNAKKNIFIKGFKAYDLINKKDLLNLIPCISNNSNTAGVYDTVSKEFEDYNTWYQVNNTVI